MRQQNHVLALSPTGGAILPGEIAALADAENFAEPVNGEFLLRLIDEAEPHRASALTATIALAALWRLPESRPANRGAVGARSRDCQLPRCPPESSRLDIRCSTRFASRTA